MKHLANDEGKAMLAHVLVDEAESMKALIPVSLLAGILGRLGIRWGLTLALKDSSGIGQPYS